MKEKQHTGMMIVLDSDWQEFAREVHGEFRMKTDTSSLSGPLIQRIGAPLGSSTIAYCGATLGTWKGTGVASIKTQDTLTTTTAVLPFKIANKFSFDMAAGDINWLVRLGATLVQSPGKTAKLYVKTNDKRNLSALLAEGRLADSVASLEPCMFRIMRKKDEGFCGVLPSGIAVLSLAASRKDGFASINELRQMHRLFDETLNALVNLGTASPEAPGFTCEMVFNCLCQVSYGPWPNIPIN